MNFKRLNYAMYALTLCCASLHGQTVTSSIIGTVVDPANAAVAGVPVTLTNVGTSSIRTGTTDDTGTYRFQDVAPGTYNVIVKATGFKTETQTGIVVLANETHNAGRMILQIGGVSESISVTAELAQVQLASSEKSETVDSAQLDEPTLKGRDLFGYMRLVPGGPDKPHVWTPDDFADLGRRTAVDQALHRLVASNHLRRIARSLRHSSTKPSHRTTYRET